MLKKIKQHFINNSKTWIGLGFIIIAVTSYSLLKRYRKIHNQKKTKHQKQNKNLQKQKYEDSKITQIIQQQQSPYAFHKYYFDKNLQIRKVMNQIQGNVNVEEIFLKSPNIIVDQYKKFTTQIRNRRRLIRTVNQNQYIQLILEYQNQVDQLLERSRQQLLDECQIDLEQFQRMKDAFQCCQDLQDLVRKSKKVIKQFPIQQIRQIPGQKLKRIIQTEVNFIKTKLYQRLNQKLAIQFSLSQEDILKVIRTLIDDIIYQKFGYQSEQIQNMINKSMSELIQLKMERQTLQNQVGNISIQSQNESEQEKKFKSYKKSQGKTQSNVDSSIQEPFQFEHNQENQ